MKVNSYSFVLSEYALCSLNSYYEVSTYSSSCKFMVSSFSSVIVKFASSFVLSCESLFSKNVVTVMLNLQNIYCPFEFSVLIRSIVACNVS